MLNDPVHLDLYLRIIGCPFDIEISLDLNDKYTQL